MPSEHRAEADHQEGRARHTRGVACALRRPARPSRRGAARVRPRQPFQSFGGEELYPTLAEKAARLAYGIAKNHPFLDGNKRTATACMGAFLRLNGFRFKPRADELLSTMLGVAGGTMSYGEFVGWVSRNL